MKLRIKGNSIRMRLTRSEVKALAESGIMKEETCFPQGLFHYEVRSRHDIDALQAILEPGMIILEVPHAFSAIWHENDSVGLQASQSLPGGKALKLVLEKDFVCLDDTDEDQSDNYRNPKANC